MVNSLLREQEFPWSRVNTGRPLDNVWFSISVRTMLSMQEGGMFVTNWVRSCGFPRHHVGFAAGRRSRVYQQQTRPGEKPEMVGSGWTRVPCEVRYGCGHGAEFLQVCPQSMPVCCASLDLHPFLDGRVEGHNLF